MRRSIGTALVQILRGITARLNGRYRPELHYMRGPGPKSKGRSRDRMTDGKRMAASLGSSGKIGR